MERTRNVWGFSPVENAEIAVAIVSQNDSIGGGGRAAPIAGKIIKKYWELKDLRKEKAQSEIAIMKKEKANVLQ